MNNPADQLRSIQSKLEPRGVRVLGVTKGQPVDRIQQAIDAGLTHLGVNYVQQGEGLRSQLGKACWHFIGHIQSRKVKHLLSYNCIESLDRVGIVAELHDRLEKQGQSIDGLVEVNIGGEATKSGVLPRDLGNFLSAIALYDRVRIRGIMVIPPPLFPVERRRTYFQQARELYDRHNAAWDCLSMGTSDDYELAVEEGATQVRLGTVLFGARA